MGNRLIIPTGQRLVIPTAIRAKVDALWTPEFITTEAWFDAQDADTITESSGLVSQWDDKSGNARHAVQAVGGSQPTYNASDALLNNKPSLTCGTSVKFLQTSAFDVKRMYLVIYYRDGVTDTTFQNHNAIISSSDGSVRLTGRSSDNHVFDGLRATQNFDYKASTGATTYRNGSTTNTNYEANGLPMPANMFRIYSPTVRNATWRILGGNFSWTPWNGGVGEIIFTDASEDFATEQKVEGYLAWRWGIAGLLPIGHPYKAGPPEV